MPFVENYKTEERWIAVPGYEGIYVISDMGNVKNLQKERDLGKVFLLSKWESKTSYNTYALNKFGVQNIFSIHRLVAESFVPNPDNKPDVNHKDGDKHNNASTNLEWVTPSENGQHAVKIGLFSDRKGENACRVKLTNANVLSIRARKQSGERAVDLAAEFGVHKNMIWDICKRKNWKHI